MCECLTSVRDLPNHIQDHRYGEGRSVPTAQSVVQASVHINFANTMAGVGVMEDEWIDAWGRGPFTMQDIETAVQMREASRTWFRSLIYPEVLYSDACAARGS